MRPLALWRHEIRRAGRAPVLGPPLLAGALVVITWADHPLRNLFVFLELGLPLTAGLGAAALAGRDPAAELQFTMPTAYRSTLMRRLAVIAGWTALVAVAISAVLLVADGWPGTRGPVAGQLTWLAPGLWLGAFGLLAGAALRIPAAASGIVAVLWLVEQLFGGAFQQHFVMKQLFLFATTQGAAPEEWAVNRLTLIGTAVVLGAGGWLLSGRSYQEESE
ncbi:hypothetical protein [Actinoplanes sp. NPDC089786]|uniref:hypothetical protein n=1 Tax=Actinoplanes sp. NPDC089786 TaxID=3155185 RepID=UPI0034427C22